MSPRLLLVALALAANTAAAQQSYGNAQRAAPAPAAVPLTPAQREHDELQTAIVKADAARVTAWIRARRPVDFNFNDINPRGRTHESPLTMSMNRNFPAIARLLLDAGADPNRRDAAGGAPIHAARSAEAARMLVAAGADPNAPDARGRTAIASAVERGDLPRLDALLAAGARLDAPLNDPDLLTRALNSRQPQLVAALLERGFDVKASRTQALWPLIESGDEDTARLLIQRGADPNARGRNYGEPLLLRALFRKRYAVAEALIDAGADLKLVDAPDCARGAAFGCVSIELARAASFNPPLLAKLAARGLDLDAVGANGHTALSSLITEQTFAVRAVTAAPQAAVAHNPATGATVLTQRTPPPPVREIPAPDNVARVRALLERGANPNIKYRDATPLMLALADPAKAGFADILVEHGARIEYEVVVPKAEVTPPVPLGAGAVNPDGVPIYNNQGVLTGMSIGPLSWAVIYGRADVALRLLARGEKVGRADRHLLYFTAAVGQSEAIPELLKHTREVNVSDRADVTPLMFAARAGHAGAVRALLAAGARVNTRSDRDWPPLLERSIYHYIGGHGPSRPPLVGGYTALRAAKQGGHAEVVRILTEAGGRD